MPAIDHRRSSALAGKVCVITGGSKGIGRACSEALSAQGAKIAILARASREMDALASDLDDAALAVPCDISDHDRIGAALDTVSAHFGRIDAVISNAAIVSLLKLETAHRDEIEREMAVNLLSPIFLTRAAIPHLRKAGGGDLIYISSESVRMPYPYLTLYGAAKGGIEVFAAGMRNELREQGTRVTVLRSGAVEGSSLEKNWDPQTRDAFFAMCAKMGNSGFSGQPATRETMAQALTALLSLPRDVNVDLIEIRGR